MSVSSLLMLALVSAASAEGCWKRAKGRGAGAPLSTCAAGLEKDGLLCYPHCNAGYYGVGPVCWASCPAGFRDDGAFCAKPAPYGRGSGNWKKSSCESTYGANNCEKWGLLWYPKCRDGYKAFGCCICTPKCPDGWTDIGVSCAKPTYTRGAGSPMVCKSTQEQNGALCYDKCATNWKGAGPVCWQNCNSTLHDCGAFCSQDCGSDITEQVMAVIETAVAVAASVVGDEVEVMEIVEGIVHITEAFAKGKCPLLPSAPKVMLLAAPAAASASHSHSPAAHSHSPVPALPSPHPNAGCWKHTKSRGAGSPLDTCATGMEQSGVLCYPPCKAGYSGIGPMCWEKCPAGFHDDGAFCDKPASYSRTPFQNQTACVKAHPAGCEQYGALWFAKCNAGFHAVGCCVCQATCPTGFVDIGMSCEKMSYNRSASAPMICNATEEQSGSLCFPKCQAGWTGFGPVCWQRCPAGLMDCGAFCAPNCLGALANITAELREMLPFALQEPKLFVPIAGHQVNIQAVANVSIPDYEFAQLPTGYCPLPAAAQEVIHMRGAVRVPSNVHLPSGFQVPSNLHIPSNLNIPSDFHIPSNLHIPSNIHLPSNFHIPSGFPMPVGGRREVVTDSDAQVVATQVHASGETVVFVVGGSIIVAFVAIGLLVAYKRARGHAAEAPEFEECL